jgi:hypothetical protein
MAGDASEHEAPAQRDDSRYGAVRSGSLLAAYSGDGGGADAIDGDL